MKICRFFLILGANFVVNIVAYYRKCYESFSLCLITNIEDIENQHRWNSKYRLNQTSAAYWCERYSSSLVIITDEMVQSAVTEFINDSAARFESDVITYGNRFLQYDWKWINGNIYRNSYSRNDYRYAYLYVSVDRTVVTFYGHATSRRKFICTYVLDYNYRCEHGFQTLNMTCYKIRNEEVTWYDARKLCLTEEHSELAIFESGVPPLTSEEYWIGLRKEIWNWRNVRAEMKYSNWDNGSPSYKEGNCLCLRVPSGKWRDCHCSFSCRYICMQAYSSNSSSSKKTSTTVMPTATTNASTTSSTTITTPIVGDPSSQFHSTLILGDDLSYKTSEEPANPFESWQSSGVNLALGIGGACVLLLISVIVAIVVIKNRRSAGRNQESPLKITDPNDAISPEYEAIVRKKRPSDDAAPIYAALEVNRQETPSSCSIYTNVGLQPTEQETDVDTSVDYVDLN